MRNVPFTVNRHSIQNTSSSPNRLKSTTALPSLTTARQFITELNSGALVFKEKSIPPKDHTTTPVEETIHPADRAFARAAYSAIIEIFESAARKRQRIKASMQFRMISLDGKIRLVNQVLAPLNSFDPEGQKVSISETDLSCFATNPVKVVRIFENDDMENPTILQLDGFEVDIHASPFSSRQLEILRLLAEGKKTAQISNSLFISVDTVRTHRQHILQRSAHSNMTATVVDCVRKGWI